MEEKVSNIALTLDKIEADDATPAWAKILINCVTELIGVFNPSSALSDRISELESENNFLKVELSKIKQATDNNEQKSRNINLLIHGVEESEKEDTDQICLGIIKKSVGVNISMEGIERTHRVGVKKPTVNTRNSKPKHRPIVVRFSSMRLRMEVFRNKKTLKGQSISISESLTTTRYNLLQKAKDKFGKQNCWTSEGRAKDGKKITFIQSESDLA